MGRSWLSFPFVLLLLVIQPGVPGSATPLPDDDSASTTVSGTVVNSVTHEPIARALVFTPDERNATFTNDRGQFELTVPASQPARNPQPSPQVAAQLARVVLQATRPGFLSNPATQVGAGAAVVPGQSGITLTLVPEGLIVGKVKFPEADSGDKVPVQLYRREVRNGFVQWTPLTTSMTRSTGEFRFANLRAGDYRVFTGENLELDSTVRAPGAPVYGFPPRFYAAARSFAAAATIHLSAGETATIEIALERQRYFDVRIPVALPEGTDNGVGVSVFSEGHRGPGFDLSYDGNLHAIVGSLPSGSYTIEAMGYGPSAVYGLGHLVVENAPVLSSPLALSPSPSVEVNIRAGSPPPEIHYQGSVTARDRQLAFITAFSADEVSSSRGGNAFPLYDDRSSTRGIKPGRYWVQAQVPVGYLASMTSGTTNLLNAPLVVPYGASVPPIEVTVRFDGGTIEATVESANPAIPGAQSPAPAASTPNTTYFYCIALGHEGNSPHSGRYTQDGRDSWQSLAPGSYLVLAYDSPQEIEYRNPEVLQRLQSQGQVVRVEAGGKTQVTLHVVTPE